MNASDLGTKKLWYLDNLKISLTVLVIIHHVGQGYGKGGWWYFHSSENLDWIKLLFVLNRSFFMSLFFMISGYFLAQSLSRTKSHLHFIKDRFFRFGTPLLLFGLVVFPILLFFYHTQKGDIHAVGFLQYFWKYYLGIGTTRPEFWTGASWPDLQLGHLWFIEHLLILSLVATVLHKTGLLTFSQVDIISRTKVVLLLVCLACTIAIVRIFSPIDRWVGLLGFIQVAYADVPRDLFFFCLGIYSFRSSLFTIIKKDVWKPMLTVASILALFYAVLLFSPVLKMNTIKAPWWGMVFPFWESFYCYTMCFGLIFLFRDHVFGTNKIFCILGRLSFGAYLVHVPVVVFFQHLMSNFKLPLNATFVVSCILGITGAYFLAFCYSTLNAALIKDERK